MEKFREWRKNNPVLTGIIAMVLFYIVSSLVNLVITALYVKVNGFKEYAVENPYVIQLIMEIILTILGLIILFLYGHNYIFTKFRTNFLRGLIPGMYLLCAGSYTLFIGLIPVVTAYDSNGPVYYLQPIWKIVVFIITCLLIGFAEELLFRGIIAEGIFQKYATDAKGVWFSAILSAFLFGIMHIMNISEADPVGVAVQVVMAMVEGLLLTAIYYRSRNIWSVAFIHGFVDFCALGSGGLFNAENATASNIIASYRPMMMTGAAIYVGITAIILRNSKIRVMLGKEDVHSTPESNKRFKIALAILIVILAVAIIFAGMDMAKFMEETMRETMETMRNSGAYDAAANSQSLTDMIKDILNK